MVMRLNLANMVETASTRPPKNHRSLFRARADPSRKPRVPHDFGRRAPMEERPISVHISEFLAGDKDGAAGPSFGFPCRLAILDPWNRRGVPGVSGGSPEIARHVLFRFKMFEENGYLAAVQEKSPSFRFGDDRFAGLSREIAGTVNSCNSCAKLPFRQGTARRSPSSTQRSRSRSPGCFRRPGRPGSPGRARRNRAGGSSLGSQWHRLPDPIAPPGIPFPGP